MYSSYDYFFTQGNSTWVIPGGVENISRNVTNRNQLYETPTIGQVNILSKSGLSDCTFNTFLTDSLQHLYTRKAERVPNSVFIERIKALKDSGLPIRFTYIRQRADNGEIETESLLVSIETYSLEERAGLDGNVFISMNLKEYKERTTHRVIYERNGEIKTQVQIRDADLNDVWSTLSGAERELVEDWFGTTDIANQVNRNPEILEAVLRIGTGVR